MAFAFLSYVQGTGICRCIGDSCVAYRVATCWRRRQLDRCRDGEKDMAAVWGVFYQTCLERHVDLLPSGQDLAAAAVAKTVLWSVGRECCMGSVFQDVFR